MKIVALLCWYDEPVSWLKRCVTSLAKIPVDHIIALDGAYGLFPYEKPYSPHAQSVAIAAAAKEAGMTSQVYSPTKAWPTELVKRDYLFRMAEKATSPDDWYMVIDADEYLTEAFDTRAQLEQTSFDVGAVALDEPGHPGGTIRFPTHPMFFRAIRGLHCDTAHFRYRTPDGDLLWGDAVRDQLEPRQITRCQVMHETHLRSFKRREQAARYYKARDDAGLENLPAERWVNADQDRVENVDAVVFGRQSHEHA